MEDIWKFWEGYMVTWRTYSGARRFGSDKKITSSDITWGIGITEMLKRRKVNIYI